MDPVRRNLIVFSVVMSMAFATIATVMVAAFTHSGGWKEFGVSGVAAVTGLIVANVAMIWKRGRRAAR